MSRRLEDFETAEEFERWFAGWRQEGGRPIIVRVPEEWTAEQVDCALRAWRSLTRNESGYHHLSAQDLEPLPWEALQEARVPWWRRLLRRMRR
jgi:hypothetical protein